MVALFDGGKRRLERSAAVKALITEGFSQATAYRALQRTGKFGERLSEQDGLLCWMADNP